MTRRTWVNKQGTWRLREKPGKPQPCQLFRWNTTVEKWLWVGDFRSVEEASRRSERRRPDPTETNEGSI